MAVPPWLVRPLALLLCVLMVISSTLLLYSFIDSVQVFANCWGYWLFTIFIGIPLFWGIPFIVYLALAIRYFRKPTTKKVASMVSSPKSPYSADKIIKRILIVIALLIIALLNIQLIVFVVLVAWHRAFTVANKTIGSLPGNSGLRAESVSLFRDDNQVVRVTAEGDLTQTGGSILDYASDVMYGQGYAHMQDRLFQMDFMLRIATGRLSTIVSGDANSIASDKLMRTLNFKGQAQQMLNQSILTNSTMQLLQSYVDGVNAYWKYSAYNYKSWELWLGGYDFNDGQPWTVADTLTVLKLWQWSLSENYVQELTRLRLLLVKNIPPSLIRKIDGGWSTNRARMYGNTTFTTKDMLIFDPATVNANLAKENASLIAEEAYLMNLQSRLNESDSTPFPTNPLASVDDAEIDFDSLEHLYESMFDPSLKFYGSAMKQVGFLVMDRTSVSPAVVENLDGALTMPNTFVLMDLKIGKNSANADDEMVEVMGFGNSLPGVPGLISGKALFSRSGLPLKKGSLDGITTGFSLIPSHADCIDLFILKEVTPDATYISAGTEMNYTLRTEVINVRNGGPITLIVKDSIHGPVLPNELTGVSVPLAVKWAANYVPDTTIEVISSLWFQKATRAVVTDMVTKKWVAPPVNFLYSDDQLSEFTVAGAVPNRKTGHSGMFPMEAETNNYIWPITPTAQNPAYLPPINRLARGKTFFINAGNPMINSGYEFQRGYDFEDEFKARYLAKVLSASVNQSMSEDEALARVYLSKLFNDDKNALWIDDGNEFSYRNYLMDLKNRLASTDPAYSIADGLLTSFDGSGSSNGNAVLIGWINELSKLFSVVTGIRFYYKPSQILEILMYDRNNQLCTLAGSADCDAFAKKALITASGKYNFPWQHWTYISHMTLGGGNAYACASCSKVSTTGSRHSLFSAPERSPSEQFNSIHGMNYRHIVDHERSRNDNNMCNVGQSGNIFEKNIFAYVDNWKYANLRPMANIYPFLTIVQNLSR